MTDAQTSWTKLNFIERAVIPIMAFDLQDAGRVKWIEFPATDSIPKWIVDSNNETMRFGETFHSIYLRWNVTVNGLEKAGEIYRSSEWLESGKTFVVQGFRNAANGAGPSLQRVQSWSGDKAAEVHATSMPMIAAWAFCNMYACLEEYVFCLYRIYLQSHPMTICEGEDFRPLRRLFRGRVKGDAEREAWESAWAERLEAWHRKKLYDGLGKVFAAYVERAGLKIPGYYEGHFSYSDVAETLSGISLIRNGFIHGATRVSKELGDFCKTFRAGLFQFVEGQDFVIALHELAALEFFTDTLTVTLNTSFLELAFPEVRKSNLT